ncbi:hypothetical protein [Pseudomonas sp. S1_F04]
MFTENAPVQVAKALRAAFSTRFALVCGLSLFITGCAVPTGTAHLFKVQSARPSTVVDKQFEEAAALKLKWQQAQQAHAALVKKGATSADLAAADAQTQQARKNSRTPSAI